MSQKPKERLLFGFSEELKQIPFLRIVLSLIIGMTLQSLFSIDFFLNLILFFAFFLLLILQFQFLKDYRHYSKIGVSMYLVFISLGMCLISKNQHQSNANAMFTGANEYIVVIDEPLVEKSNSYKAIVKTLSIKKDSQWHNSKQKVLCYFKKSGGVNALKPGDKVWIHANLAIPEGFKNPNEFDYKKHLYYKHISLTAHVDSGNWKTLSKPVKNLKYSLYTLREYFIGQFSRNGIENNEHAVLSALVWGYTGELNDEIYTTYSATGAMHILSVSGLHVGIVYLALVSLLRFFKRVKYYHILNVIIIILGVWLYAVISGMSPSVLRAATMLSFVEFGISLKRKSSTLNSLALAAFILLVYDPFQLFDVGFQLSFLALLGILLFYSKIYGLLISRFKAVDWVSQLIAVSIAAQLGTLPLCLLYFHQFPNYFLLTNIAVIPLSTIILYMGVFFPTVGNIQYLNNLWSQALEYVLKAMNGSLKFIEQLPGSSLQNIDFSILSTILIFGFIGFFFAYICYKRYYLLITSLAILLLFTIENSVKSIICSQQKYLLVYKVSKQSAIDIVHGNKHCFISNSFLKEAPVFNSKGFYIHHRIKREPQKLKNIYTIQKSTFLIFSGKKYLFLNNTPAKNINNTRKIALDAIILSDGFRGNMQKLSNHYTFKKIIIDSSVTWNKTNSIENECKEKQISCYSVARQGAYIEAL